MRLHLSVLFVGSNGISNHVISGTLDGSKVLGYFFRVILDEFLIANVENLLFVYND